MDRGDKITDITNFAAETNEIWTENTRFSSIIPTTFGLSGFLTNISFHETDIIGKIGGFIRYPCIRVECRAGIITCDELNAVASRGNDNPRGCFGSSILMWIQSRVYPKIYKFLLFRNGKFSLSGAHPERIVDIINCCKEVLVPIISAVINIDPQTIELEYVLSTMKNYRWTRIIAPNEVINFNAVERKISLSTPPYTLSNVSRNIDNLKLDMRFQISEATAHDRAKKIYVSIFLRGKIKILGARNAQHTRAICEYIANILTDDAITTVDREIPDSEIAQYISAMRDDWITTSFEQPTESII